MVLIASAVPKVLTHWTKALKETFQVFEVQNMAALEQSMKKSRPPILLLDLGLPRLGGVGGVAAIQRLNPSTSIILFTVTPDDREAIHFLKAGAKGYCQRDIPPSLLIKAVKVVQKGEIWVGRKVIPGLLEELASLTERREKDPSLRSAVSFSCLSPRERQIAYEVGNGSTNKEISRRFNITERTVKAHLTAIFRKLKISDRLRLALIVTEVNRASR